jgi:hypothetical protein
MSYSDKLKNQYSVYVLVNNQTPIYVGCTSDIEVRISSHRRTNKDFTDYVIVKTYDTKKDALIAENSIIRYLSIFINDDNVNGKFSDLSYLTMYKKKKQ